MRMASSFSGVMVYLLERVDKEGVDDHFNRDGLPNWEVSFQAQEKAPWYLAPDEAATLNH